MKEPKEYEVKLTLEELNRLNIALMPLATTRGEILSCRFSNGLNCAGRK